MKLHEKHISRIRAVNESQTESEHLRLKLALESWRLGIEDAGRRVDLIACDNYYLDQGVDRPMCCGVWLDWIPA